MGRKVERYWLIGRLALLGTLLASGLLMFGCGGGSGSDSYDDPDADYRAGDAADSLIEVQTLRDWDANAGVLDDGLYATDLGEQVILVDATDTAANMTKYYIGKGHIPGALVNYSHEGGEAMDRNDGPIVEAHDVADGAAMDKIIQTLGITKDAVVVITTSKMDTSVSPEVIYDFCAHRLYWTMKYWGFSSAKVKVLNGYNAAWQAAGYPLVKTNPPTALPSTFSVRDLPGLNLQLRTTIGEMIALVDSGKANKLAGDVIILDMRQPLAGFSDDEGCAQAVTSTGGSAFDGIIKGAVQIPPTSPIATFKILSYVYAADGVTKLGVKYKSKDVLQAAFAAAGIDGTKPIVVYCNSGASATRYWYPMAEILGYNVSLFDASMQMWQTMAAVEPGDLTYVRYDSTSPNYLASNFFYWDATAQLFRDASTDVPVATGSIKVGGNLGGDFTWDTVTRSERVTFRPHPMVNNAATGQTYNALGSTPTVPNVDIDWRPVTTYPAYRGDGAETKKADAAYQKSSGTTGAPTSTGGGAGGGC